MVLVTLAVQADGEDEPTILEISPRIVLQWEKANSNRSSIQLSNDAVRTTYLYEVAWQAMGKPGEFDKFCETTDVAFASDNAAEEEDGSDPTQPAAPTES